MLFSRDNWRIVEAKKKTNKKKHWEQEVKYNKQTKYKKQKNKKILPEGRIEVSVAFGWW